MPITAVRCWFSVIPANVNYRLRSGADDVLAALPAIPLRDIPATGVGRPGGIPRFARQRHGIHVLLQGRQIAFERPCGHPRTSRRELSGEVCNCHLKPSNRSSDSLNDLLNSSSESIASSRYFIEDSALLKASRVVELVSEGSDGFQLLNVLLKPSRRLPNRLQSPLLAPEVGVGSASGGSARACGLPRMPCTSRGVP